MSLTAKLARWFGWSVLAFVAILACLHVVNAIRLDARGFSKGAQELVDRAEDISDRAMPEYQELALATLPPNPNNGPFYRFDDNLAAAKSVQRADVTQQDAGGEFEFQLEFEDGDKPGLVASEARTTFNQRDGRLVVTHRDGDSLVNETPLQMPLANISEIIIRARADRGNRFEIHWAAEGRESSVHRNRLNLDLIADGEFHTYIVDAQNALQRNVRLDENISMLTFAPSNVDGAVVEIEFIRVVSKQWKYQALQVGTSYESVGGELRPVLHMIPNQQLEYEVEIPREKPVFSFGAATLLNSSPIEVSISIDANGENSQLFESASLDADQWQDQRVDLSAWAGQKVRVTFDVRGPGNNVAFFSNPIVRSAVRKRFNVILVLEDTTRADHLSVYGYDRDTTPGKARFMDEQGIVFLNAHSQATKTRPSVPAMMTSLFPTATGVWNFSDSLSDRYLTVAEIMRAQGYITASLLQNGNAGPYAGVHQGFSVLRDTKYVGKSTEAIFDQRTLDWIDDNKDQNFFLYVHAADPHGPFDPPPPHDRYYRQAPPETLVGESRLKHAGAIDPKWAETPSGEARRLLYDGEINHNDAVIETFIQELKDRDVLDDTLLIFVSDHGEWLGEDRRWEHNPPGQRPVIHVPFMVSYPRVFDTPKRIEETVQIIDAMPTILELASVDTSNLLMHGDSLVGLVQGSDPERWQDRITVSEEPMIMTREDPCVCGSLFFGEWQLHGSLESWPLRIKSPFIKSAVYRFRENGIKPVVSYLPDLYTRRLRHKTLSDLLAANVATWRKITEDQQQDVYRMDPEVLEKLRGLGYVN